MNDLTVAQKMVRLQQNAVKRNIKFDLSFRKCKELMSAKKCRFTGEVLTNSNRSIDRLDASIGYIDSNVVACTKQFNSKKGCLTAKDISSIYKALKVKKLL